jgi:hypothetical protein
MKAAAFGDKFENLNRRSGIECADDAGKSKFALVFSGWRRFGTVVRVNNVLV